MLVFGIVWSVSPMRFVNGYRALIFRDKVTRAKWWGICGLQYFRSCGRRYGRLLRSLHPLSVVDGRVSLDRAVTPASVPPEVMERGKRVPVKRQFRLMTQRPCRFRRRLYL